MLQGDSVGVVMKKLRETGMEENTLVFFMSDNGGPTRELTASNAPLRDGKAELLEGGVRVPFIISWNGRFKPWAIDAPIISLDATVTALELGRADTESPKMDGISLLPLLTGVTVESPHDALFWRLGKKNAVRQGDWKLIREHGGWQLYNLADDIGETKDIAPSEAKRVAELSSLWTRWNARQSEPLWK